jgi:hypothetical protein
MKGKAIVPVMVVSALLVVPCMTGCEGDDGVHELVGNWLITSVTVTGSDVPGGTMTLTSASGLVSGNLDVRNDGTVSGTFTFVGESDPISGTWSAADGLLTVTDSEGTSVMPYTLSGDTLTFTATEEGMQMTMELRR